MRDSYRGQTSVPRTRSALEYVRVESLGLVVPPLGLSQIQPLLGQFRRLLGEVLLLAVEVGEDAIRLLLRGFFDRLLPRSPRILALLNGPLDLLLGFDIAH